MCFFKIDDRVLANRFYDSSTCFRRSLTEPLAITKTRTLRSRVRRTSSWGQRCSTIRHVYSFNSEQLAYSIKILEKWQNVQPQTNRTIRSAATSSSLLPSVNIVMQWCSWRSVSLGCTWVIPSALRQGVCLPGTLSQGKLPTCASSSSVSAWTAFTSMAYSNSSPTEALNFAQRPQTHHESPSLKDLHKAYYLPTSYSFERLRRDTSVLARPHFPISADVRERLSPEIRPRRPRHPQN